MKEGIKDVYTMIDKDGDERSRWVKIGIGFINKDDSMNIYLDALPVNGKMNVRDAKNNGKEERS